MGAGGLAAEVSRLADEGGAIVAPALVINRRQRHQADRAALAELWAGHAPASQAIRTEAGWEHEEPTPLATREAMADAVVADIDTHGAEAVVALAVSHVDCEDLADRIRARLSQAGRLAGPALAGPGWGSGERSYAAGDRVLLHTKPGQPGLHNGLVGTVVAVERAGLRVAFDDAGEVVLAASFVAGRRGDGNSNLSHAWARTIDGAQGGTWEAVHLLGSASLDALVGYTGQSRGRAPTHTWNTRPLAVVDVGGVVADDRSGAEVVLAGLSREPVTTFAATDDPWVLDARLSAERAEHRAVLDTAPPDYRRLLSHVRDEAALLAVLHASAEAEWQRAQERLARFAPLAGLRRASREERDRVQRWVERAQAEAEAARTRLREAAGHVAELEAGEGERSCFAAENRWRTQRVGEIDDELARHWAAATLAAVGQDDPLAFGIDRLRAARATYARSLADLDAILPPGRTHAIGQLEAELSGAEVTLRQARLAAAQARRELDVASRRHWGRRDNQALNRCRSTLQRSDEAVAAAVGAERDARRRLEAEVAHQRERTRAMEAVRPQRVELTQALAQFDAGLDDTRAARVAAMAADPRAPDHLVASLGEPPADPAARQVWCALAYQAESYRDRHPEALGHEADGGVVAAIGPRPGERWRGSPEWDALAGQLTHGAASLARAARLARREEVVQRGEPSTWIQLLDQAGRALEAETANLDRGISWDHGIELGFYGEAPYFQNWMLDASHCVVRDGGRGRQISAPQLPWR